MYSKYAYGKQLGFTAGTMSSIMEDLDLSIAQVSLYFTIYYFICLYVLTNINFTSDISNKNTFHSFQYLVRY